MSNSPRNIISTAVVFAILVSWLPAQIDTTGPGTQLSDKSTIIGFNVVLLLAHNNPGPPLAEVPQAVVKALQDVTQFLPFKNYSLLDSAIIRGANGGTTLLDGPSEGAERRPLIATIESTALTKPTVRVLIRDNSPQQRFGRGPVDFKNRELTVILDTTFVIESGETVVVGTSRFSSPSHALVVILTALPPSR